MLHFCFAIMLQLWYNYRQEIRKKENPNGGYGILRRKGEIGKQKYSERMKLSVHQAASYVIARRGQGYQDKLVK